jgi:phosphotransferase system HPr-like phosphotransfer protein
VKELKVKLDSIDDVKEFVALTNKYAFEIDLVSGRYAVDAKSIMGIFSLDLSKSLALVVHTDNAQEREDFIEEAEKFLA